ncbi:hypothetical protein PRZ48_000961 [Zasmidium cellare]|uniref:Symplekin/Pta1 N-terminal domain-containing protein n=1 Tax=Zasmidium cellare TaxID=395010 RepID=A0ABR0EZZ3_ZASCE|nr:hypothetical protein PRZ48_000961 [Zasmidium cellare]
MASTADTLTSLNSARDIVLKDHTLYPQVVPGILQVISPGSALELRRWGAEFLAETFASQAVTPDEKQQMCQVVLDTLRGYLSRKETMGEEEDTSVVKSAVQCAASVYPYVFRHTVNNPKDSETWGKIVGIKSSILRMMDNVAPGVNICCIKFVACVVQTQTPGLIADPRRPEQNEISLALVPRDHPVIPPANLEAEASGLLDRLLGVLQDNVGDPLTTTATLNSLATLVQRRASVSSKILTTVLSFNPLKLASRHMSGKDKIAVKSMTRTTMSFLLNCLKRNPNNAFAGRIQQQVERLKHTLIEAFSETHHLKRPAPDEPVDGLDDAKRQRLDTEAINGTTPLQQRPPTYAPLPQGPVSLAQLWTLTNDPQTAGFHAERLPSHVVTQLIPALVQSIPQTRIDEAINVIRSRWLNLGKQTSTSGVDGARAAAGDDEDDDYDPTLSFDGDTDQVLNRLDQMPPQGTATDVAIGPFNLPPPPPLTEQEHEDYSRTSLTRVIGTLTELDKEARVKGKPTQTEHGFNRLTTVSASGDDKDGWLTLVTRLATRATFDLEDNVGVKKEGEARSLKKGNSLSLPSAIREALLNYVMENFRARIGVAITWLNEEWYSDRLLLKEKRDEGVNVDADDLPNYWHWTLRLFDAMMPYFDVKDGKVIIRFLSEIPAINRDVFNRVKKIAEDPERVDLSAKALLYLIMFRPPIRDIAVDCAEQMWRENQDAKTAAANILKRWRPAVLKQEAEAEVKTDADYLSNGWLCGRRTGGDIMVK